MHTQSNFKYFDANYQYLFFKNTVWMITGGAISQSGRLMDSGLIPNNLLLEHDVELQSPAFEIIENTDGGFDIKVLHQDCLFFNFLVQTSRVRYNQEMAAVMRLSDSDRAAYLETNKFAIAGPLLSDEHQGDQKQILISKIFALGFLLHRYKDRATPWAVSVSDQMLMDDGRTLGGTGKSLCFGQALSEIIKPVFNLYGRDSILKSPFKFQGLTKKHQLITIDDAVRSLPIRNFYEQITGDILVVPKGKESFVIPFEDSPKILLIYDCQPQLDGLSTQRRVLPVVFSDYYHNKNDEYGYTQGRTPKDDFGKNLFMDFTEADYSNFFTTMANCLSFKLSVNNPYVLKTYIRN